jgi:hypothetical protein
MNSRRVLTGTPVVVSFSDVGGKQKTAPVQTPADDYAGRLLKYIPAEIVAAYLVARGIVLSARPVDKPDLVTLTIVAIVAWIMVPAYFYWVTTRGNQKPLTVQIVLATIAFPIWVFAIGELQSLVGTGSSYTSILDLSYLCSQQPFSAKSSHLSAHSALP